MPYLTPKVPGSRIDGDLSLIRLVNELQLSANVDVRKLLAKDWTNEDSQVSQPLLLSSNQLYVFRAAGHSSLFHSNIYKTWCSKLFNYCSKSFSTENSIEELGIRTAPASFSEISFSFQCLLPQRTQSYSC